jgi:hypothetical protein
MTTHTETHQLDTDLTLRDSSQFPLSVHAVTLTLTKQKMFQKIPMERVQYLTRLERDRLRLSKTI